MKKLAALVLALALTLSLTSALAVDVLTMGTGGTSGTYYAFGSEIASLWNNNIEGIEVAAQPTGASKANIVAITDGEFQLGWSQNDTISYAYNADPVHFEGQTFDGFYAIAALYPEAVQIAVAADSDIKSVADLKGKKVSVGAPGSGTFINAVQVLESAGLTLDDISQYDQSFGESADAFQNLQLDAFFVVAGVPNTGIISADIKRPVRLLSLTPEQDEALKSKYAFYVDVTVPANTYSGVTEDTVIPSITAVIIVSKDLSEEVVYNLTKTLFEKAGDMTHAKSKELDPEFAVQGVPCPIHPGAAKYYAEIGVEIPEISQMK
ncbi:MAG: TAXI family TRAP transporter solute-binding subunit [Eubacteriales bacterium]|jgi:TRAP transporter TAXI family solute receptor|nr:TAXI family TRAP transporter solute-binding subunit [Eubacteriales bacterium]MDD4711357.1 TAXI family TRAP transporter solute-binding subunit [Eubacteriales bacterium]